MFSLLCLGNPTSWNINSIILSLSCVQDELLAELEELEQEELNKKMKNMELPNVPSSSLPAQPSRKSSKPSTAHRSRAGLLLTPCPASTHVLQTVASPGASGTNHSYMICMSKHILYVIPTRFLCWKCKCHWWLIFLTLVFQHHPGGQRRTMTSSSWRLGLLKWKWKRLTLKFSNYPWDMNVFAKLRRWQRPVLCVIVFSVIVESCVDMVRNRKGLVAS